jgi:hypothetical protein
MILETKHNLFHNFWIPTHFSIAFTSFYPRTKLGNTLESKRAGGSKNGPAAQRPARARQRAK